ncbi:hypothetical protein ACIQCJ_02305 [Streptomyces sp. NPDC093221]|uniref:hypothetical protein n=1 Tax=Streptomyces sp. NPDC093221 TaxID=3366032 RepID=UPI00381AD850
MSTANPYQRVTSLKYLLISAVALIFGLFLLYLSGTSWFEKHHTMGNLSNQLGGLVIASVALTTLWELAGRRSFFQEMLEVVHLKSDVDSTGLEAIGVDYRKAVDWDGLLGSARNLDVFAAWATTWRNTHQVRLTNLAARSDAKIRICLPDVADLACVQLLAKRFNLSDLEVQRKIDEAVSGYKALDGNAGTGRVEIYTSSAFHVFTAYRIDDHFVVTFYHHKDSRSGTVPTLQCRSGGTLYAFFKDDLEGVLSAGAKIYP